jgi:hypothetical protein
MSKIIVSNFLLFIFITCAVNSFAQDPSIKNMQTTVFKEIKIPKFDSTQTWLKGGRFDLTLHREVKVTGLQAVIIFLFQSILI